MAASASACAAAAIAYWLVMSMRRALSGGIQRAASKSRTDAAQRAAQPLVSNCVTGATALLPAQSASANAVASVPKGLITPRPVIAIRCMAGAYVTIGSMPRPGTWMMIVLAGALA